MNRVPILLAGIAWFLASGTATFGDTIIADSTISEVIVYRDRAMIFRRVNLRLPAGTHRILFQHLPGALLTDSLRISSVSEPVKILAVTSRRETLEEQKESREQRLRDQLRHLEDDLQAVLDEQETSTEQIEFYRRMGESAGPLIAEKLIDGSGDLMDWQSLYRTLAERMSEAREAVRELEPRRRDLEERIAALQAGIAKIEESVYEAYEVAVDIETLVRARPEVIISYVVQGAAWSPFYDVRYLEEQQIIEMSYRAVVRQRTGEPWSDVLLTLSTGRPLLYGRPKELTPWYVGLQPTLQTNTIGMEQISSGEAELPQASLTERDSSLEPAAGSLFKPTELDSSKLAEDVVEVAASFQIPTKETVPSGSANKKVTVSRFQFPARLQYIAIPRQGPYTFLRAVMTNDSSYALLGGQANIFLGNDFLSTVSIRTTLPGSTLDFYLGTDPQIEVRQTELERTLDSSGLILRTGQEIQWRWKLDIFNRRNSHIVLEVVDQIPVPQHKDVKLEDFRCPDESHTLEENGTVRWVLDLGPNENRTITYSYKLKFPKGAKLSGLQ